MNAAAEGHRPQLLVGLRRFVQSVRELPGVNSIAVLGSIVTTKPNPKDIDVLVVVADNADLTPLATAHDACRATPRASIGVLTYFSPMNVARTSGGRAAGETAVLVCDARATHCIAGSGHIFTMTSMRYA